MDVLARPKGASHPGQGDAHLLLGQAQAGGDLLAVYVEPLGRDVQVDPAILGGHGQPGLRSQRRLVLHAGLVVALHPYVRLSIGLAVDDADVAQHVAEVVHVRGPGLERRFHVDNGRVS